MDHAYNRILFIFPLTVGIIWLLSFLFPGLYLVIFLLSYSYQSTFWYIGRVSGDMAPFFLIIMIPGLIFVVLLVSYAILMFIYSILLLFKAITPDLAKKNLRRKGISVLIFQTVIILAEYIFMNLIFGLINYYYILLTFFIIPAAGTILIIIGGIISIISSFFLKSEKKMGE